jgi:lipoprotein-releasing system ATP-binding protein
MNERATASAQTPVVRVENLVKTFVDGDEQIAVLRGVNLNVVEGEIVAIVGASGAGKSTLLHLVGGLDRPTEGRILFGETDVTQLDDRALATFRNRDVGFVFQFHHLFPEFSAVENVAMTAIIGGTGKRQAFARARELLSVVGLGDRLNHRPPKLSGGERQRVAIARSLINEPRVVLADEPTGNLDRKTSDAVHDLMWQLRDGMRQTFIVVTHNRSLAERADRIALLADGRIAERDFEMP